MPTNWECTTCTYTSDRKANYIRHQKTHLTESNEANDLTKKKGYFLSEKICSTCQKSFLNRSSYSRHILHFCSNKRKKKISNKTVVNKSTKKNEKDSALACKLLDTIHSLILEMKELKQNNIGTLNNTQNNTQNTYNNCKLITINYLNQNFPNVIPIETFKDNLKTTHQITKEEANRLTGSLKLGFNQFADEFIKVLDDNCLKQITDVENQTGIILKKEGIFPVLTTDSNLRTHNEKTKSGWERTANVNNLNEIFHICNDQIFYHTKIPILLNDRQKANLYNRIRKSHFFKPTLLIEDTEEEVENRIRIDNEAKKIKEEQYQQLLQEYKDTYGSYPQQALDFNLD